MSICSRMPFVAAADRVGDLEVHDVPVHVAGLDLRAHLRQPAVVVLEADLDTGFGRVALEVGLGDGLRVRAAPGDHGQRCPGRVEAAGCQGRQRRQGRQQRHRREDRRCASTMSDRGVALLVVRIQDPAIGRCPADADPITFDHRAVPDHVRDLDDEVRPAADGEVQAEVVAQEGDVLDLGVELVGVQPRLWRDGDAFRADGQRRGVAGPAGRDAERPDDLTADVDVADVIVIHGGDPPGEAVVLADEAGDERTPTALRRAPPARRSARCVRPGRPRRDRTSPSLRAGRG